MFLSLSVKMEHSSTVESSGLISARCELNKKVIKEDKDAEFYCEVSYFVPGAVRMTETNRINITVYCEFKKLNISYILLRLLLVICQMLLSIATYK